MATSVDSLTAAGTDRPTKNPTGNGNGSHPAATPPAKEWGVEESARLYGVNQWGQGYFSINAEGHVGVHPSQDPKQAIDLKKLVDELRERDIQLPVLIRFTDILKHRVNRLAQAFSNAIKDHDYKGEYR